MEQLYAINDSDSYDGKTCTMQCTVITDCMLHVL